MIIRKCACQAEILARVPYEISVHLDWSLPEHAIQNFPAWPKCTGFGSNMLQHVPNMLLFPFSSSLYPWTLAVCFPDPKDSAIVHGSFACHCCLTSYSTLTCSFQETGLDFVLDISLCSCWTIEPKGFASKGSRAPGALHWRCSCPAQHPISGHKHVMHRQWRSLPLLSISCWFHLCCCLGCVLIVYVYWYVYVYIYIFMLLRFEIRSNNSSLKADLVPRYIGLGPSLPSMSVVFEP